MKAVCLIDSSVFCEILQLAGVTKITSGIRADLKLKIERRETLFLPMTAILETGNLVARIADGVMRRASAERFSSQVRLALAGDTPFTPTPLMDAENLAQWVEEFVEWVTRGGQRPSGFLAGG